MPSRLDQPDDDASLTYLYPFIVTRSKGGPYDDASFAAGVMVGQIDRALTVALAAGADRVRTLVRTDLVAQLELVGMARGFPVMDRHPVVATEHHVPMPDWSFLTFMVRRDGDGQHG